jgi:hypothetical protein
MDNKKELLHHLTMKVKEKKYILALLKKSFNIKEISIMIGKSRSYVHRLIKDDLDYINLYKYRRHTDEQVYKIINDYKSIDPNNREIRTIFDVAKKNDISIAYLYKILTKYNIKRKNNTKHKKTLN